MKKVTAADTKDIVDKLIKSDCEFKPRSFGIISKAVTDCIDPAALDSVNEALAQKKKGRLTLSDVARIAYVHIRSIKENGGSSPVERVEKYLRKNGLQVDRVQIASATELLLKAEIVILIDGQTTKGKCRKYDTSPELKTALFGTPDHKS